MVQKFTTELTEPHLNRLVSAINQLNGARVLITGGTGFVGKWLIESAKIACDNGATSFEIVVPTRSLNSKQASETKSIGFRNLSFIEGDILSQNLDLGKFDSIIHAATPASAFLNDSNPAEMTRINIEAMRAALKFASDKTPFLFTSSGAVYGDQPQTVSHISEDQIHPFGVLSNAYAQSKRIAEEMCREAAQLGLCNPIITRLFTFSGHYLPRDTHFAIGNFVQNALDKKPIIINGDGRPRRSYLYGADMATWLWCALEGKNTGKNLHVGSDNSISIYELAQAVARVSTVQLNYTPDIEISTFGASNDKFHQYVPSTTKTQAQLNVKQWTALETGIELMIKEAIC